MRVTIFAPAMLCMASVSLAKAPIDGLYGSVFGGFAYVPNNVSKTIYGLVRNNATYRNGFDAGGSFGYKNNPMRYEAELTYLAANLKHLHINNVRQRRVLGYTNAVLGMANVYYDFQAFVPSFEPFVGIGLGYGWVHSKLNSYDPYFLTRYSTADSVFAYQATAGLTFNFAENYALTAAYRYVGTDRANHLGEIVQAHLANVGIVYRFDYYRYK